MYRAVLVAFMAAKRQRKDGLRSLDFTRRTRGPNKLLRRHFAGTTALRQYLLRDVCATAADVSFYSAGLMMHFA